MLIAWDNLVTEIKNGKCAIFLGHGLLTHNDGVPMYTHYCQQLFQDYNDQIDAYYPEENFFLFKQPWDRSSVANALGNLYQTDLEPDKDLYRMLAEIPVRLYISVSPDSFLENALGEAVQTDFFNIPIDGEADAEELKTEIAASKERPLVYHIFGSVKNSDSIILSHDDLFDFFKSMLGEQGLPVSIRRFFGEAASGQVVFLGFSFKKWYAQLLLRLFNLSKPGNRLFRTAYLNTTPPDDEVNFANGHFKVKFIQSQIKEFVTMLHQKCKEKNVLRKLHGAEQAANLVLATDQLQRIGDIDRQLIKNRRLLAECEESLTLSGDILERERLKNSIKKLKEEIEALTKELQSIK